MIILNIVLFLSINGFGALIEISQETSLTLKLLSLQVRIPKMSREIFMRAQPSVKMLSLEVMPFSLLKQLIASVDLTILNNITH